MGAVVEIKNVRIGEGVPKICVPITAGTKAEILSSVLELKGHPFDLIEWRADFLRTWEIRSRCGRFWRCFGRTWEMCP